MPKEHRGVNPADAFRKEQRKLELKKQKKGKEQLKGIRDLLDNPHKIEEEIQRVQKLSDESRLDKSLKDQIKELKDMLAVATKKQKLKDVWANHDTAADASSSSGKKGSQSSAAAPTAEVVSAPAPPAPSPGAFMGPPRRPEESIYYHPVYNPSGAPPPGLPQQYKPLPQQRGVSNPSDNLNRVGSVPQARGPGLIPRALPIGGTNGIPPPPPPPRSMLASSSALPIGGQNGIPPPPPPPPLAFTGMPPYPHGMMAGPPMPLHSQGMPFPFPPPPGMMIPRAMMGAGYPVSAPAPPQPLLSAVAGGGPMHQMYPPQPPTVPSLAPGLGAGLPGPADKQSDRDRDREARIRQRQQEQARRANAFDPLDPGADGYADGRFAVTPVPRLPAPPQPSMQQHDSTGPHNYGSDTSVIGPPLAVTEPASTIDKNTEGGDSGEKYLPQLQGQIASGEDFDNIRVEEGYLAALMQRRLLAQQQEVDPTESQLEESEDGVEAGPSFPELPSIGMAATEDSFFSSYLPLPTAEDILRRRFELPTNVEYGDSYDDGTIPGPSMPPGFEGEYYEDGESGEPSDNNVGNDEDGPSVSLMPQPTPTAVIPFPSGLAILGQYGDSDDEDSEDESGNQQPAVQFQTTFMLPAAPVARTTAEGHTSEPPKIASLPRYVEASSSSSNQHIGPNGGNSDSYSTAQHVSDTSDVAASIAAAPVQAIKQLGPKIIKQDPALTQFIPNAIRKRTMASSSSSGVNSRVVSAPAAKLAKLQPAHEQQTQETAPAPKVAASMDDAYKRFMEEMGTLGAFE